MSDTALIARCPGCHTTAPVVEINHLLAGALQVFAPHTGETAFRNGDGQREVRTFRCGMAGHEAGEVLEDTPANREALALKWIGKEVCPECLQRPVARKRLCAVCVEIRERQSVRRYRIGGRR